MDDVTYFKRGGSTLGSVSSIAFCNVSFAHTGICKTGRNPVRFGCAFSSVGGLFVARPGGCSVNGELNIGMRMASLRTMGSTGGAVGPSRVVAAGDKCALSRGRVRRIVGALPVLSRRRGAKLVVVTVLLGGTSTETACRVMFFGAGAHRVLCDTPAGNGTHNFKLHGC